MGVIWVFGGELLRGWNGCAVWVCCLVTVDGGVSSVWEGCMMLLGVCL